MLSQKELYQKYSEKLLQQNAEQLYRFLEANQLPIPKTHLNPPQIFSIGTGLSFTATGSAPYSYVKYDVGSAGNDDLGSLECYICKDRSQTKNLFVTNSNKVLLLAPLSEPYEFPDAEIGEIEAVQAWANETNMKECSKEDALESISQLNNTLSQGEDWEKELLKDYYSKELLECLSMNRYEVPSLQLVSIDRRTTISGTEEEYCVQYQRKCSQKTLLLCYLFYGKDGTWNDVMVRESISFKPLV